jgi:transposase
MLDVERLIEDDHPARAIWELVGRLDLTGFAASISSMEGGAGRPAYAPHLLISLWVYAYSRGIGSAREVARRCEHDPAFRWLTGLMVVSHHTLSDFRLAHRAALNELFTQLLGLLSAEGLIATAPKSGAGSSLRLPPNVPIAVRTAPERTTERRDVIGDFSLHGALPVDMGVHAPI